MANPDPASDADKASITLPAPLGVLIAMGVLLIGHLPSVNAEGTAGPLSIGAVIMLVAAATARNWNSPRLWLSFLDGLFLTLVSTLLIGAMLRLTPLGAAAERLSFEARNATLDRPADERSVVQVVDISSLARDPVTDRRALLSVVRKLVLDAEPQDRPRAIGVDVNFHRETGGYLNPNMDLEDEFLEACYRANWVLGAGVSDPPATHLAPDHVPARSLLLGVEGALPDPRSTWLVAPRYAALAASIEVPTDVYARSYSRFRRAEEPDLPAMGYGLASAFLGAAPAKTPVMGIRLFGEQELVGPYSAERHCLDFGRLPALQTEVIPLERLLSEPPAKSRVAGRVVLLGDVSRVSIEDAFAIPGQVRAIPGVFIHALSAETLIRGPLYEFDPTVNVAFDVGLGVLGMACVTLLPRVRRSGSDNRLHATVTITTALFVQALTCLWLFGLFRIVWLDAFGVALGLGLGAYLDHALDKGAAAFNPTASLSGVPSKGEAT